MSLAGHNKGKKWVPGVGYRYPKIKRVKINLICDICGLPVEDGQSRVVMTTPKFSFHLPVTSIVHEDCMDQ
jgi:hypothetical protein